MSDAIPIFIIARNRVTYLIELIEWLERSGNAEEIHIIDNESRYGPLLDYYKTTPHTVHFWDNGGQSAPWNVPWVLRRMQNSYFVVTDHDVMPNPDCPDDVIDQCISIMERVPGIDKVGPSLEIGDIPDHNYRKKAILEWEGQFWQDNRWMPEYGVWNSPIDTTFAVHRAGTPYKLTESVRLHRPYTFRHQPWYTDFDNLSEEEKFYMDTASEVSNWSRAELPNYLQEIIDSE